MSEVTRWFSAAPPPVRPAAVLVALVLTVWVLVDVPDPGEPPAADPDPVPAATPDPAPAATPDPAPPTTAPSDADDPDQDGWVVHNVVDGDTVDVRGPDGAEERIRIIGIDTPERGECGFSTATRAMEGLVLGEEVTLIEGAREERDRYGRLLRYVEVDEVDAGLQLIEQGLAIARYDGRDGYGRHPRQDVYVSADATTEHLCGVTHPAD